LNVIQLIASLGSNELKQKKKQNSLLACVTFFSRKFLLF
jgi:hypothetical protein